MYPAVHFPLTGDLGADVSRYLTDHGCPGTAEHVGRVAREARRLATAFGLDPAAAVAAGWLHDISAVIPPRERLAAAHALGLEVLPEEREYPPILHQKLSVVIAREQFGIADPGALSAMSCHTTLKAGASPIDKLVFLADKLEWDQADAAPYREELLEALTKSLDHGASVYLSWMHRQRGALRVVHPWLRAAYQELTGHNWED